MNKKDKKKKNCNKKHNKIDIKEENKEVRMMATKNKINGSCEENIFNKSRKKRGSTETPSKAVVFSSITSSEEDESESSFISDPSPPLTRSRAESNASISSRTRNKQQSIFFCFSQELEAVMPTLSEHF